MKSHRPRSLKTAALALIGCGLSGLVFLSETHPLVRLGYVAIGLVMVIKVAALLWQVADGVKIHSRLGILAFFAWPGVRFDGFAKRSKSPPAETGRFFLESWLQMLAGFALLLIISFYGRGESTALNYVALIAVLFIVHMGMVEVVADGWRLLGFSPRGLFERPLCSQSLREFWSERWNRAFVDMNKIFLLEPLRKRVPSAALIFGIFLVSGVLHEIAISYPADGPWGWPLLYFSLQGVMVLSEKWIKWPRPLVLIGVLAPMPILFPPQFVDLFLGGLTAWIYANLFTLALADYLYYGLLAGAGMHLLVLCASVQVPSRMNWQEEFRKLSNLNRKVFWTYGAYILTIIIFMSAVSFYLANQPQHGVGDWIWILFIALFWLARLAIDFLYMKHSDWPKGPLFTVGHICLSTLFISMVLLYSALTILVGMRAL